jgi:hypothetical protein
VTVTDAAPGEAFRVRFKFLRRVASAPDLRASPGSDDSSHDAIRGRKIDDHTEFGGPPGADSDSEVGPGPPGGAGALY